MVNPSSTRSNDSDTNAVSGNSSLGVVVVELLVVVVVVDEGVLLLGGVVVVLELVEHEQTPCPESTTSTCSQLPPEAGVGQYVPGP